jgi:hypothetical protein
MHAFAAAGAGFLLAVLWFDLLFDVQVRAHEGTLPSTPLESIAAYYRRVTTDARPMNRLVTVVMLLTLLSLVGEIAENRNPVWLPVISFAIALSAMGLAAARTFRNAAFLGRGEGTPEHRSNLARTIYRDHFFCLAAIVLLIGLQLSAA